MIHKFSRYVVVFIVLAKWECLVVNLQDLGYGAQVGCGGHLVSV
jgi:hypothetical protein